MMRHATAILLAVLLFVVFGCVERRLIVTSDPPGARVYLDDEEKGQTPVTFRFNFYGYRTLTLKKDGYRVKEEVRKVKKPIYELPLLDMVADLTPIPLKDHKKFHFKLEPVTEVPTEDLLDRAKKMKARVVGGPVPEKEATPEEPKPAEGEEEPVESEEHPPETPTPTEAGPAPENIPAPNETTPPPDHTETPPAE